MAELTFQELNLMQMLDVLRPGGIARLALARNDQPYVIPMAFQLEMQGVRPILHLASPAQGRKVDILRSNDRVCLEIELPSCAWIDTVLVEGRATVDAIQGGVEICVQPHSMTGRRFFRAT